MSQVYKGHNIIQSKTVIIFIMLSRIYRTAALALQSDEDQNNISCTIHTETAEETGESMLRTPSRHLHLENKPSEKWLFLFMSNEPTHFFTWNEI